MSNAFTERRIGRFFLDRKVFEQISQAQLQAVFRDMAVLECRASFAIDAIEYLAAHPDFEPVERGGMIPDYVGRGVDEEGPDGGCFVTWERVK